MCACGGMEYHEILWAYGISPLIVKKESGEEEAFYRELLCYIESGIPIVAAIDKKAHAVAVVGHGELDCDAMDNRHGLIDSSCAVASIIVNDDNFLPYFQVERSAEDEDSYGMNDIDLILVPLYNRVHQEYAVLYERVMDYLETGNLDLSEDSVVRIYLASAVSMKRRAMEDKSMDLMLKSILVSMEMPKFVWCVEISDKEEYKNRKISARMIIDSTASPGVSTPWLLVHDREKIKFLDSGKWYEASHKTAAYNMYQHNLREVEPWK